MNTEALISLINNAAFLLALAVLYNAIPYRLNAQTRRLNLLTGVILGVISIALMVTPWQIRPGVIFDTRSILLSTAGLFFGAIPAIMAAIITGLYRLYLGGVGAWTGVLVIVISTGMGILWRQQRTRWFAKFTWQELYGFGLLVHVAMLLCMLTLPWPLALEVLSNITFPVLIVYPLGVMLLGRLLAHQLERQQLGTQLRYQANMLKNVSDAVISTDMNFRIQSFNKAAEKLYGWPAQEATGRVLPELIPTEYPEHKTTNLKDILRAKGVWQGEVLQKCRNSEKLYVMSSITLLRDDAGSPTGIIAINRDITQYRQVANQNQLLLKLTTAIAEAADLETAWRITLEEICKATGWNMGEVWLLAGDEQQLILGEPFYCLTGELTTFRHDSEGMQFSFNEGLPGKVWATKKAFWLTDIFENATFLRAEAAKEAGLRGSIGIPVLDNHEVVAVMNFLLTRNPTAEDEQMITVISAVGAQMGTAVQHKQIEDQLQLQSAALNAAANAIVILNKEGIIQWANPAFTTLTGFSEDESLGKSLGQLITSGMQDKAFFQNLWDTILSGNAWHGEIINRRKDGTLYTEEQTITPVKDKAGNVTQFIAIKQDITARKETEVERARLTHRIQEQAERIQDIISTVPMGVLMVDQGGRIYMVNPVARSFLETLTQVDEYETILYLGDRALEELLVPLPEGQWHEVRAGSSMFEVIPRPITSSADPDRWVLVIKDVTQERTRQRYQQAQEQLALVGQLAAGIAHDFNNIMGVIMIYSQMLQEIPGLSAINQRRLSIINEQAQHASALIGQILDFSRRSIMEVGVMDLLPLVKELIKLLERTLPENIQVTLNYDEKSYKIKADPTRIQQALMNLAINARDAMPQGGELHFNLAHLLVPADEAPPLPDMQSGDWIRLDIQDTGEGVTSENIPHLFEPFFTTKTPEKGTGLGLAQVYGILKQHEGSITVESAPGEGARFTIYLPLVDLPETVEPETAVPVDPPTGQETILLVEDDMAMRLSVDQALARLGYKRLMAANGTAALDILAYNKGVIDLVLSDMVMPDMGGMELSQIVRQEYPNMKLLLMSGHLLDESNETLLQNEQIDWLAKPFDIMTLAVKLRSVLDRATSP